MPEGGPFKSVRPPLAAQLTSGLAPLEGMHDLTDRALCDRWIENPYFPFFCGEEFFRHRLDFDQSADGA